MSTDPRSKLAIALDVSTPAEALAIAKTVSPYMGVAKIGLQLFVSTGPTIIEQIKQTGMDILLDLKLHDIPNTVGSAAKELGKLGVKYTTSHTQGGADMLKAAVAGLAEGADEAGVESPLVLAVTVLTSDKEATADTLQHRVKIAESAGCGVVCAPPDLGTVKGTSPEIFALVPGIRLLGGDAHDQVRIATPSSAIADGADLLVIGRAVTGSDNPAETAQLVAEEVASASTA